MVTALLVVDVQNVFRPMLQTAIPNIKELIAHFKSQGWPYILTQHGHSDEELTAPYTNPLVRKFGAEGSIRVGTNGWRLVPEVEKVAAGCIVVGKTSFDAFIRTGLEQILRDRHVDRVMVCGALTDFCVDTSARSAFNRGFETLVVHDACGADNKAQHQVGLDAFTKLCGALIMTKEVLSTA